MKRNKNHDVAKIGRVTVKKNNLSPEHYLIQKSREIVSQAAEFNKELRTAVDARQDRCRKTNRLNVDNPATAVFLDKAPYLILPFV